MATSLYRKHRPQTWGEISGQRHIVTTLRNELEMDRVAHAYLFAGPRGTGKTTTSRILAKSVNCLERPSGQTDPCNTCAACMSITRGNALDVVEIDAASHTGVDHVREHIISSSRVSPTSLKRKIFIIDEVHMLSLAAFNALLKTLEEPPSGVLFILATTEVSKLPATIISRCQRFDFKKVVAGDILERLAQLLVRERREVATPVLEAIVTHADGSVRDAESLLEQILALGDDPITLDQAQLIIPASGAAVVVEFLTALASRQTQAALVQLNRLVNEGVDLPYFASEVTAWLRCLLLLKSGAAANEVGVDLTVEQRQRLEKIAAELSLPGLVTIITIWLNRCAELKYASIPQLPLELAVVDICLHSTSPSAAPRLPPTPPAKTSRQPPRQRTPQSDQPLGPLARSEERTLTTGSQTAATLQPDVPPATGAPIDPAATPSSPAPAAAAIALEEIKKRWGDVLTEVKTRNFSLFSLLRVMQPINIIGPVVQVGVAYDFHLERLAERKNRDILEHALSTVHGVALRVDGVMVPTTTQPAYVAQDQALQTLLQDFGGKVVE